MPPVPEGEEHENARVPLAVALLAVTAITGAAGLLIAMGKLTLDLGLGRRVRPLGPQLVQIAAPRELVFDLVQLPYGTGAPRELRDKISVLERDGDMVLAAHRTKVGWLTTVTVETVTFARPERIAFRLVRGPVPLVTEEFVLRELEEALTELAYRGELWTDGWGLGQVWGALVAGPWERTVARSLDGLKSSAEAKVSRDR
ncbi:MAG: SRPBCC family protein [Geminicoccales bacterium]